jgi:hypothetical protein
MNDVKILRVPMVNGFTLQSFWYGGVGSKRNWELPIVNKCTIFGDIEDVFVILKTTSSCNAM